MVVLYRDEFLLAVPLFLALYKKYSKARSKRSGSKEKFIANSYGRRKRIDMAKLYFL